MYRSSYTFRKMDQRNRFPSLEMVCSNADVAIKCMTDICLYVVCTGVLGTLYKVGRTNGGKGF